MDVSERDEIGRSSKKQRVTETPQLSSKATEVTMDTLRQQFVQFRRNVASLKAAFEIEKAERKRWEHLYKDLYCKMRIEQSEKEKAPANIPKESEREPGTRQKGTEVDVREKEEDRIKILELEKELDVMRKSIQVLEEKLKLMEDLKQKDDMEIGKLNEKVHDMEIENKKLKQQGSQLQISQTNLTYENDIACKRLMKEIKKKMKFIDELNHAQTELISALGDITGGSDINFKVKNIGELDVDMFLDSCKLKFPHKKAEFAALEAHAFWQDQLNNPQWNPFKITLNEKGDIKELLNEDDKVLLILKKVWGYKIYNEVTKALKELNECNPSGRYSIPVLWNSKEGRRATVCEVIHYMRLELQNLKCKRS